MLSAGFILGHLILVTKVEATAWGLLDEITILFALTGFGLLLRVLIHKYK